MSRRLSARSTSYSARSIADRSPRGCPDSADAPSLAEAKTIGEQVAKEFLDHLSFVSNLKVRLRDIFQIFNWEPGGSGVRDCLYFTRSYSHDDAPYEALESHLLDTIGMLQAADQPAAQACPKMVWQRRRIELPGRPVRLLLARER
jgi:hypothetical protein